MHLNLKDAQAALPAFGIDPKAASLQPLPLGHINATYRVVGGPQPLILQHINAIFPPQICLDWQAACLHLQGCGLPAPLLLPTLEGSLWTTSGGHSYRLQQALPGRSLRADEQQPFAVWQAGYALAQWHRAMQSAPLQLAWPRRSPSGGPAIGLHDTQAQLAALQAALATHRSHPHYADAARLAEEIIAGLASLPDLSALPPRVVHGDPKLNNLLYTDDLQALAWIDLDTLGRMPLHLELGDALRSWCNPGGEEPATARFSLPLFSAALAGYLAAGSLSAAEAQAFIPGMAQITLELAARFTRDALEENYFGWDAQRFPSRSAHNLSRARSQLRFYALSQADDMPQRLAQTLADMWPHQGQPAALADRAGLPAAPRG